MATVRQVLLPDAAQFAASAFPGLNRVYGTNFPVLSLAYDATTSELAYWRISPLNYGSGNLTATVEWYADTASSGGVVWEAAIAAITPNADTQDVETKAFATATNVADTHLGTTGQRLHSADVAISNLDSLAAGDALWLRIARLPANASDTMTGDALLIAVILSYSDV